LENEVIKNPKKEINIKSENNNDQIVNKRIQKKALIETDNELINEYYNRYKLVDGNTRSSFKTVNNELKRMINEREICIPIFLNV